MPDQGNDAVSGELGNMTVALNSAVSGLVAARQALDTASRNIANASTPGYTRKIMQQQNFLIAGQGAGTIGLALTRVVNNAMISAVNKQQSFAEGYAIQGKYLNQIVNFHGASDTKQSLSAKLTDLANTFTQLSTSPDNFTALNQAVQSAAQLTNTMKGFSNLLTGLRSDAENDISGAVANVNTALTNIASLNAEIGRNQSAGQSTADLEDQRDNSIAIVAKYINITTFKVDNGGLTVITPQGEVLADTVARQLYFQKSNVLPTSYYPGGSLSGLTVGSPGGADITQTNLGGQLGALFDMRDNTLPQYQAQMDEFAYNLAQRFNNVGIKLFTDLSGNIPPNNPNLASPLGYLGFSSQIQVNPAITADPALLRNGTTGNTEDSGSNEVIRRVAQYAFGPYQYQRASGSTTITGIGSLTTNLPLTTSATVVGTVNVATYAPDLSTVSGLTLPGTFTLTVGGVPQTITILATHTAANVVSTINGFFPGVASLNSLGQFNLTSNNTINIADGPPGTPIGAGGIAALGLSFAATLQKQPNFVVHVGTRSPVTISIAPADTSVQLLAKLNAVPGLGQYIAASINGSNGLQIIPRDGGDLRVIDGVGAPLAAMGITIANIAQPSFAQNNLGPGGNISAALLANSSLPDYIASIISNQAQADNVNKNQQTQENTYLQTLTARNQNYSGVNIDQELSELIKIQAAYSAAAKMISATQKLFDDLLNALR